MKKAISMFLALMMFLVFSIPAFAEGGSNVNGGGGDQTGGAASQNTSWPSSMPQGGYC